MHRTRVRVVEDALDANNTIARANRADFDRAGVTVVNLMSAPGRGQDDAARARRCATSTGVRVGVLEGDVEGSMDADRLAVAARAGRRSSTPPPASAASATSTRTWSARRCRQWPSTTLDLLVIENVGNLVCPAEFRVGEDVRVMVCSVTEGEDKPLKYPLMFRACELVMVNKVDLLPHLDFDLDRLLHNLDAVHPGVPRMLVSARTGEGVEAWRDWLVERVGARGGGRLTAPAGSTVGVRLERARGPTSASSPPRPSGSRGCATAWPSASRAAGGCSRSAARAAARSDARHVAVEFVHPVIVGKRALPAHRAVGEGGAAAAQVELLAEPDDIVDRLRRRARRRSARRDRGGRGCLTIGFGGADGRVVVRAAGDDPFVAQELVETLYHVLWELVHVFFEHRGLLEGRQRGGARRRRVELPLPVPGRARGRPRSGARRRAPRRC